MKPLALAGALVLLGACAAQVPEAPPAAGPPGPARAQAEFVVRTVAETPAGRTLEVRGIDCVATSGAAATRFASPARVSIPDAGEGVRVDCAGGDRRGGALVLPRQAFARGGWQAYPTIGIGVGTGWGGGTRVGTGLGVDVSPVAVPAGVAYDDVRILLR
jgi:hypothetical protein